MELVEENNKLRIELESARQQALLMQNGDTAITIVTATTMDSTKQPEVKNKCVEFALDIDSRLPRLPGPVASQTTTGNTASPLPEEIVPCLYSQ